MITIGQLIDRKGSTVHTVSPEMPLQQAVSTMVSLGIGALVVSEDTSQTVIGIISERDIMRHLASGIVYNQAVVADCMSSSVLSIARQDQATDALHIMTNQRIRHLPVMDEQGKLLGLVSIGDLVKAKLEEQNQAIEQLGNYIGGIPT